MPRPARLLYSREHPESDRKTSSELVASSDDGIPFLWMVLFGGRNFWEPDDSITARGGASADRNRWVTPLEVAEARLLNAGSALQSCDSTKPYTSSARILARRVASIGKRGFLHVEASWLEREGAARERMASLLALTENYVNYADTGQRDMLPDLAAAVEHASPFVPHADGRDMSRLAKLTPRGTVDARRVSVLMCGVPAQEHEAVFFEAVDSEGTVAFSEAEAQAERDARRYERIVRVAGAPAVETPNTLLSRLKSMISRKGEV